MLRTIRMARLEVIIPTEKVEEVTRSIGYLGLAKFVNINAQSISEQKYRQLTEEMKRSPREERLQQVANRLNNVMKKIGEIPYPRPITIREDLQVLLTSIEKEVEKLEAEVAQVENLMKEVLEEKTTIERDVSRFYEEYESVRKFLTESKAPLSSVSALGPRVVEIRDRIRGFYNQLLEAQRTLSVVDAASKLSSQHETIPNDELQLLAFHEKLKDIECTHSKIREVADRAKEDVARVDQILREIREIVDKKIDAIQKLKKARADAEALGELGKKIYQEVTVELSPLLSKDFFNAFNEACLLLEKAESLSLDESRSEEPAQKLAKHGFEIARGVEILDQIERFSNLDRAGVLLEEIKRQKPSDLAVLHEKYQSLLKNASIGHLAIIERALRILSLEQKLEEIGSKPVELSRKLGAFGKEASLFHVHKEIVDIELKLEDLKRNFRQTGSTTVFEVWVRRQDHRKAIAAIEERCPSAVIHAPKLEEEHDKPPTEQRTPVFFKPYEALVRAIGRPNYREIDPTMIMVITFPIFFGMMFGDMGQGLIVLLLGIFIRPLFRKFKLRGALWDPLLQGRNVIIMCGASAIVFGFLYGSFFGETTLKNFTESDLYKSLPIPPIYSLVTGISGFPAGDPHAKPWLFGITFPNGVPWFAPFEPPRGPIILLKVSIIVAVFQLLLGMALDIANKIVNREYRHLLASSSRFWFQASLSFLLLRYGFRLPEVLFNPSRDAFPLVGLFIVPIVGMIVLHRIAIGNTFEGVSEAISRLIEAISNTASYARILALGMIHAVFNLLAILGGSSAFFWVLFIAVNLLMLIALNGILAFVHALRLHWVEWFSKFYTGDGSPFDRFTIQRKFTVIS